MDEITISSELLSPASSTYSQDSRIIDNELGKDDFLRILITQLQNQNPISPIDDKEFIAQMAQFSSLEQMTNLSHEFSALARSINGNRGLALLGKTVEIEDNGTRINGVVSQVALGDNPMVRVGSQDYDLNSIIRISQ